MTVISVPIRLRLATAGLLLSIPLIALEIIIVTRAPWWNLPYQMMGYWALAFSLICFPLIAWINSGKRWAYFSALSLAMVWLVVSAWIALRMKYPPLGFFSIFLLGYFIVEFWWLKYESTRSFFDPELAWYQELPKPIPGIECQVGSGEKRVDLRVSRIDKDGIFVFSRFENGRPSPLLPSLLEKRRLDVTFRFRDRQLTCVGVPILSLGKGLGAGIQFLDVSPDLRKEIGDFVETLRGEGYV